MFPFHWKYHSSWDCPRKKKPMKLWDMRKLYYSQSGKQSRKKCIHLERWPIKYPLQGIIPLPLAHLDFTKHLHIFYELNPDNTDKGHKAFNWPMRMDSCHQEPPSSWCSVMEADITVTYWSILFHTYKRIPCILDTQFKDIIFQSWMNLCYHGNFIKLYHKPKANNIKRNSQSSVARDLPEWSSSNSYWLSINYFSNINNLMSVLVHYYSIFHSSNVTGITRGYARDPKAGRNHGITWK